MRYAAKRIWPDRPKSWEHQGDAESLESFALAFAEDRGLGAGTQIMVLDKDSEDAAVEILQVTATDPYALAPGTPTTAAAAQPADPSAASGGSGTGNVFPPVNIGASAFSFLFFMVKVAIGFTIGVFLLGFILRQIFPQT